MERNTAAVKEITTELRGSATPWIVFIAYEGLTVDAWRSARAKIKRIAMGSENHLLLKASTRRQWLPVLPDRPN